VVDIPEGNRPAGYLEPLRGRSYEGGCVSAGDGGGAMNKGKEGVSEEQGCYLCNPNKKLKRFWDCGCEKEECHIRHARYFAEMVDVFAKPAGRKLL